jgi:hypothetical protein
MAILYSTVQVLTRKSEKGSETKEKMPLPLEHGNWTQGPAIDLLKILSMQG